MNRSAYDYRSFSRNLYRLLVVGIIACALASMPSIFGLVAHAQSPGPNDPTIPAQPFPLSQQPIWESVEVGNTTDLAWADVDGDGDLDLAVATISGTWEGDPESDLVGRPNILYLNTSGQLAPTASWQSPPDNSWSVAWGDMDRDGDLDLVVGNDGNNKLYLNSNGRLEPSPLWTSDDADITKDLVIADVNGDGWYDLVAGNLDTADKVYLNQQTNSDQIFPKVGRPIDNSDGATIALQIDDFDGDGILDLFASQAKGYRIYVGNSTGEFIEQIGCATDSSAGRGIIWPNRPESEMWSLVAGLGQSAGRRMQYGIFATTALRPLGECPQNFWVWDAIDVGPLDTYALDVADINGDGLLDLTTAWAAYLQTANPDGPAFERGRTFLHTLAGNPGALAWADVDGDGDLDLALSMYGQPVRVYRNESALYTSPQTLFGDFRLPEDVAMDFVSWADVDNDGDYDLLSAVTSSTAPVELRINDGGALGPPQALPDSTIDPGVLDGLEWSNRPRQYRSYGWGDYDGDGLIDLALAVRADRTLVFRNTGGNESLPFKLVWTTDRGGHSAAWGDVDQDGDLDLAVGRISEDLLFLNEAGVLAEKESWSSTERVQSDQLTWFDVDGDGDVDLVAASENSVGQRVYLNNNGSVGQQAINLQFDLFSPELRVDINGDGRPDRIQWANAGLRGHTPASFDDPYEPPATIALVTPGKLAPAFPAAQAGYIEGGVHSVEVELSGPERQSYDLFGYFSLDRGHTWQPATPTTDTRNLPVGPHTYTWDFYADGLVGANDDVRLRLQMRPNHTPAANGTPRRNQIPFAQADTLAFRVFGKQVRATWANGEAVEGAVVFQREPGAIGPAQLIRDGFGIPTSTDKNGFLRGRSRLAEGDRLIALSPVPTETVRIPFTEQYTLFYTSGAPNETGVDMAAVDAGGVQTLTLSTANRLLLFHLNVSLEWDARNDEIFLQHLEDSFQRASAILYDVTNGQTALGDINLFHDKAYWAVSDVVILADNSLRPSAAIGGLVNRPTADPDVPLADGRSAYIPGQIRMGTVWDPYGENTADLGEDWSRALAHELAHYLFFLPDNYLGLKCITAGACDNAQGAETAQSAKILRSVVCPGSFMTTTRDPSYTEFLTAADWEKPECPDTLAQSTTQRNDWQTITTFYPMLVAPTSPITGPVDLPLDVTSMIPWAFADMPAPYPARNFDVRSPDQSRLRLPNAQAFLYKTNATDDPTDDMIVALGSPTGGGDRLKVRGARGGDRFCVLDTNQGYAGCIDEINTDTVAVEAATLHPNFPAWQPAISAVAPTAYTVTITVAQTLLPGETLHAQIFPLHYGAVPGNAPVIALTSNPSHTNHAGSLTMRWPAFEVAVRLWVDAPDGCKEGHGDYSCIREAVTILRLGPETWDVSEAPDRGEKFTSPRWLSYTPILAGPDRPGMGGPDRPGMGGPDRPGMGGPDRPGMGGAGRSINAPVLSADAQVVIYSVDGFFADTFVKSIQALPGIPEQTSHPWLVSVGQAYRIEASPSPVARYISITYLQRDVPEGYEHTLSLFFLADGEKEWQRVVEGNIFVENLAVGKLDKRSGVYAVMASLEMPLLQPRWNLLAYPLPVSRPVSEALVSIAGSYAEVQTTAMTTSTGGAPTTGITNVDTFQPNQVYWIYITADEPVSLRLAPPVLGPDGILR